MTYKILDGIYQAGLLATDKIVCRYSGQEVMFGTFVTKVTFAFDNFLEAQVARKSANPVYALFDPRTGEVIL